MIALTILTVGVLGAMRVFPVGLRASNRSELRSRAAIAAQRTLESLKTRPCAQLAEETATTEEGFTVTTRIAAASMPLVSEPARLKQVETAVSWTQEGQPRALTFVTYVRCGTS